MQAHERNQVRMNTHADVLYKTLDGQMAEADKFEVEVLRLVQELAQERADKYSIPAFKFSDKLGYCWLMAGNRKRQTYYSEARIINDFNRSVAEVRAIIHEDDAATINATEQAI